MTDAAAAPTTARIATVRAELRDDTAFVATPSPRLTWTVETDEPGWRQASAELRAGDESVTLDGDGSVLVAWPFEPLAVGERRSVQVRATAASGTATEWSDPLEVAAGFLGEAEWVAEPIGLAEPQRPAQPALLRTAFTVDASIASATLFYTALGVAEPELNGTRVDDDVLAPGWTSYRDRLVHETVDVTALVREGENVLGATIAGAWYTEKYGFFQFADRVYGDQPSLIAQLRIEYADGRTQVVATGDGWRAFGDAPVVDSGIYAGEHADLRRATAVDAWSTPKFDATAWPEARRGASAREGYEHVPVPEARIAPPVRRVDDLPVADVITSPRGATILDFGQNLVGRLRITVDGPAGTTVTLRHAEVLEDGELSPVRCGNATATDVLRPRGDGPETWEPRFTFHGFRYAQVERLARRVRPRTTSTAVVLPTTCARTGWFESSRRSCSTGSTRTSSGACAATSSRSHRLPAARRAPRLDRRHPGLRPDRVLPRTTAPRSSRRGCATSPTSRPRARRGSLVVPASLPSFGVGRPTAAWGDAATVVPWVLYERFGDTGMLATPTRACARGSTPPRGSPGAPRSGTAIQLGDWLDPDAPPDKPNRRRSTRRRGHRVPRPLAAHRRRRRGACSARRPTPTLRRPGRSHPRGVPSPSTSHRPVAW